MSSTGHGSGGWLLAVLVAGMLLLRRRGVEWSRVRWMYPVPDMERAGVRYTATVSNPAGTIYADGSEHRGVDIMYQRRASSDLATVYRPGTADGTKMFFMPAGTPVLAAADATVWSAERTPRGWSVVLSHDGTPFATYYTHMQHLTLTAHRRGLDVATGKPTRIKAGHMLGVAGVDPYPGGGKVRHLHFAVWYGGTDSHAVDPGEVMKTWERPGVWKVG